MKEVPRGFATLAAEPSLAVLPKLSLLSSQADSQACPKHCHDKALGGNSTCDISLWRYVLLAQGPCLLPHSTCCTRVSMSPCRTNGRVLYPVLSIVVSTSGLSGDPMVTTMVTHMSEMLLAFRPVARQVLPPLLQKERGPLEIALCLSDCDQAAC